jgi:DNA-binding CsgD family transcriptional regulator
MALEVAELFNKASTERALSVALDVVAERIGASSYAASRFATTDHGRSVNSVCRFPAEYEDVFVGKDADLAQDPVMQHLRTSSLPIVWNSSTYIESGRREMFGAMADFGVRSGIALTLHLGDGRHFCIGFNWADDSVPCDSALVSYVQTCAVFAEPAFYRVWNRLDMEQLDIAALTQRELECLYWAGRGLPDPMVGAVMGIGRSVEKRLQSAYRKLGTSNRAEAAVLATRLGLLETFHLKYGRNFSTPTIFPTND